VSAFVIERGALNAGLNMTSVLNDVNRVELLGYGFCAPRTLTASIPDGDLGTIRYVQYSDIWMLTDLDRSEGDASIPR
jgi:hypothetical protein